jgi:ferric-dicitrate binding protein FerR (iron transport regulator)
MTKDPLYEQLREISWRRKLTNAEETQLAEWLVAHPEARSDWDSEAALNKTLAALPDVPVASNFTARLLQAAQREAAMPQKGALASVRLPSWWTRWLPKAALAALVLGAGLLSYDQIKTGQHKELARSLTTVSQVSLPGPEILSDFDAIAAMGSAPPADEELLKILE